MGGIVRAHDGVALGIDGTNNHVHMLIKLKPAIPLASVIRFVKTGSSKWMNELPATTNRFNWQTGYGAFSVSESQASRVLNYIRDQKLHHREQSFEDELELLLTKHSVSYDAKYIWD